MEKQISKYPKRCLLIGRRIVHPLYGEGVVKQYCLKGRGRKPYIKADFGLVGTKWIRFSEVSLYKNVFKRTNAHFSMLSFNN